MNKLALNTVLAVLLVAALVMDHMVVASSSAAVKVACETRVAYEKSKDLYCMQVKDKKIDVAQQ